MRSLRYSGDRDISDSAHLGRLFLLHKVSIEGTKMPSSKNVRWDEYDAIISLVSSWTPFLAQALALALALVLALSLVQALAQVTKRWSFSNDVVPSLRCRQLCFCLSKVLTRMSSWRQKTWRRKQSNFFENLVPESSQSLWHNPCPSCLDKVNLGISWPDGTAADIFYEARLFARN